MEALLNKASYLLFEEQGGFPGPQILRCCLITVTFGHSMSPGRSLTTGGRKVLDGPNAVEILVTGTSPARGLQLAVVRSVTQG